jgi:hypothetical protein
MMVGCGDANTSRPASLTSPNAIEVASRAECGSQNGALANFTQSDGCHIGLVVNADTDRLAFADLGRRRPFLADLDGGTPGVNHLRVGERPVDVTADEASTAAFTLNQTDSSVSVVDLWRLSRIETIQVPEGPQTLETVAGAGPNGVPWVVTTRAPDQIVFQPGARCYQNADDVPSDAPEVTSGCVGRDIDSDQIPLPGRPSTSSAGVAGDYVYVGYHDKPFVSVIVPPERDDVLSSPEVSCRGARSAAPCEVERIGVTYGCSDQIDNDGDGLVDQADPQCYGPKGSESPDGIGRAPEGPCSNGIDDDGDGQVDRADDECIVAGGSEDSVPTGFDPQTACSNGQDDDGDGQLDRQDPDCYGRFGQREASVEVSGIDDLEVGPAGRFAYAVDRSNNQVLTFDVARQELIDGPAAIAPDRSAFTDSLGIQVGGSPLAVGPYVSRSVEWRDSNQSGHGIVSHAFGTYVTADNGSVYFLEAARTSCEVTEPSGELLTTAEFRARGDAFENSAEKSCLELPPMPIASDESSDSCESVETCRSCLDGAAPSSSSCETECENIVENRRACRTSGRLTEPGSNVRLATNPRFQRLDSPGQSGSQPGRVLGGGQCSEPNEYLEGLRTYRQENPSGSQSLTCSSALRPQPLSIASNLENLNAFGEIPRLDLLHRAELNFQPPGDSTNNVRTEVTSQPYDVHLRSETVRVIWEGILPQTRRNDGIVSRESADVVETGGLNACSAGIQQGDRLQVLSTPQTGSDAPEGCDALVAGNDQSGRELRSYRVTSVRPGQLGIETIDGDATTQTLPQRGCYPDGMTFQVRASDTFIVVGSRSGYQSSQRASHGVCVASRGATQERYSGRVDPGEWLMGPYYDFQLYDGPVSPIRTPQAEFGFNVPVQRNFSPWTFGGSLLLGTDVVFAPEVSGGAKLMAVDVSRNRIYLRNFAFGADSDNAEQFLR